MQPPVSVPCAAAFLVVVLAVACGVAGFDKPPNEAHRDAAMMANQDKAKDWDTRVQPIADQLRRTMKAHGGAQFVGNVWFDLAEDDEANGRRLLGELEGVVRSYRFVDEPWGVDQVRQILGFLDNPRSHLAQRFADDGAVMGLVRELRRSFAEYSGGEEEEEEARTARFRPDGERRGSPSRY